MIRRTQLWLDEKLDEAEEQHRCLTPRNRLARDRLRRAYNEGVVFEVMPGLFARPAYWDSLSVVRQTLHVMQALQLVHPSWIFAGPSAALANGLAVSNRYLNHIWLATNRKQHRKTRGPIRSIIVSGDRGDTSQGLRTTSWERTVGDCVRIMDFRSGLAVADSALRIRPCATGELAEGVASACPRMQGIHRIKAVIRLADGRAESGGESIARATMLELGFAPPELQRAYPNPDPGRDPYRVDFAWQVSGGYILGELDGFEKYSNTELLKGRQLAQIINDEHHRQSYLETFDEVLRVVRFAFSDVVNDAALLDLLTRSGVPRTFAFDDRVQVAGGTLRCR